MKRLPVEVECYSGGRSFERPRRVIIEGREHRVARLLEESIEQSVETRSVARRYRVQMECGMILELTLAEGEWSAQRY
jgi:hypothetical protein